MARKKFQTLTEPMFYILLCLTEECCGVDITEQVRRMTQERVLIGPGTLYTLLADFEKEKIIRATRTEGRRKSYIITPEGTELLQAEYRRLQQQVEAGRAYLDGKGEAK